MFRKLRKTAWSIYLEKRNKTEQQGKKKQEEDRRKNKQEKRKTTKQTLNQRHNHSQDMIRITIQVFSNYSCTLLEKWSSILNTRFTSSNCIHLCFSMWCCQVLNGLLSKNRIVTPCTCINFEAAASLQQDLLESNVDFQGRWSHDAASDQHELKRLDKALAKRLWKIYTSIHPSRNQGLMVPKRYNTNTFPQNQAKLVKPLWSYFDIHCW